MTGVTNRHGTLERKRKERASVIWLQTNIDRPDYTRVEKPNTRGKCLVAAVAETIILGSAGVNQRSMTGLFTAASRRAGITVSNRPNEF